MNRMFACSAIAAHAIRQKDGFRQMEMRFLMELYISWVRAGYLGASPTIHNNQIRRFLHNLKQQGFATSRGSGQQETFRMTRAGLLHLMHETYKLPCQPIEKFLFIFNFAKRYKKRLAQLVFQENFDMPRALELEIDSITDTKHLKYQQLRAIDIEIRQLEENIRKVIGSADMARRLREQRKSLTEIATEIEKQYPYDLNAQKKLSELYLDLPTELVFEEMTLGNDNRANNLWGHMLENLKYQKRIVESL